MYETTHDIIRVEASQQSLYVYMYMVHSYSIYNIIWYYTTDINYFDYVGQTATDAYTDCVLCLIVQRVKYSNNSNNNNNNKYNVRWTRTKYGPMNHFETRGRIQFIRTYVYSESAWNTTCCYILYYTQVYISAGPLQWRDGRKTFFLHRMCANEIPNNRYRRIIHR